MNSQRYSFEPVTINEHSVSASAPGKSILFGEHAVVYGKTAIAAALSDLRITVLLTPCDDPEHRAILITMPDLKLAVSLSKNCLQEQESLRNLPMPPAPEIVHDEIEQCLKKWEHEGSLSILQKPPLNESDEIPLTSIIPVIYLLLQMAPSSFWRHERGMKLWVRSKDLPVGAGLGSSAAFSVALSATLYQWRFHQDQHDLSHPTSITQPTKEVLSQINDYAYAAEVLLHGFPSGLDNTVATFGGALGFTKNWNEQQSHRPVSDIVFLDSFPTLRLLLVHTHVPRSTKVLVEEVRTLFNQHPTIIKPLLKSIEEIVIEVKTLLMTTSKSMSAAFVNDRFFELVKLNQGCLQTLGVSNPRLDRICEIVNEDYPHLARAKLTGAGGGGCAIVFIKPLVASDELLEINDTIDDIRAKLERENYSCFSSRVGGHGVFWEDPVNFVKEQRDASQSSQPNTRGAASIKQIFTFPNALCFAAGATVSFVLLSTMRRQK